MKSGLPFDYYKSEELWIDFLLHGYIDHHNDNIHYTVDSMINDEYKYFVELVYKYFEFGFSYFNVIAIKEVKINNDLRTKFNK